MTANGTKYVLVTPVRDEEAYVALSTESVARQTVLPTEWAIVNDGSSDSTGQVIDEFARQYPFHERSLSERLPPGARRKSKLSSRFACSLVSFRHRMA